MSTEGVGTAHQWSSLEEEDSQPFVKRQRCDDDKSRSDAVEEEISQPALKKQCSDVDDDDKSRNNELEGPQEETLPGDEDVYVEDDDYVYVEDDDDDHGYDYSSDDDSPPENDDVLLGWVGGVYFEDVDVQTFREVYGVYVESEDCKEAECRSILGEIGCGDRFIARSVENRYCFYASLYQHEAIKLKSVSGVRNTCPYRLTFRDA